MSANPLTRKKYHEKGKVRSTKNRGDFMQKIIDKAQSREEAREKEKYWKSGCGKERLRKMVNSFSNK